MIHHTIFQIDNLVREKKIGMLGVYEADRFLEIRKTILRASLIIGDHGVGTLSDISEKIVYYSPMLEETRFDSTLWFTFEMTDGSLVAAPAEAVLLYEYKCEIL